MVVDSDGGLLHEADTAGPGSGGNVDIQDSSFYQADIEGLSKYLTSQPGGPQERFVDLVLIVFRGNLQRKGQGRYSEKGSFDSSGDGPGIDYIYSHVGPGVQSGNHQLRGAIEQFSDGELYAISRPTAHGPAGEGPAYLALRTEQGFVNGQRMARGRLTFLGSDYGDLAKGEQIGVQSGQTGGK